MACEPTVTDACPGCLGCARIDDRCGRPGGPSATFTRPPPSARYGAVVTREGRPRADRGVAAATRVTGGAAIAACACSRTTPRSTPGRPLSSNFRSMSSGRPFACLASAFEGGRHLARDRPETCRSTLRSLATRSCGRIRSAARSHGSPRRGSSPRSHTAPEARCRAIGGGVRSPRTWVRPIDEPGGSGAARSGHVDDPLERFGSERTIQLSARTRRPCSGPMSQWSSPSTAVRSIRLRPRPPQSPEA